MIRSLLQDFLLHHLSLLQSSSFFCITYICHIHLPSHRSREANWRPKLQEPQRAMLYDYKNPNNECYIKKIKLDNGSEFKAFCGRHYHCCKKHNIVLEKTRNKGISCPKCLDCWFSTIGHSGPDLMQLFRDTSAKMSILPFDFLFTQIDTTPSFKELSRSSDDGLDVWQRRGDLSPESFRYLDTPCARRK